MIRLFNRSREKSDATFLKVDEYIHQVNLNFSAYPELNKQLQLLDLTKKDLAILKQLQPYAQNIIPVMVNQFYDAISQSSILLLMYFQSIEYPKKVIANGAKTAPFAIFIYKKSEFLLLIFKKNKSQSQKE